MTQLLPALSKPTTDPADPPSTPTRSARRPRPAPRIFRPDIEGLRAFAVLAVVLYHADFGVRGGFVGVDVFFVISGFLITRQLVASVDRDGVRTLPTFYVRRMRRLLPAAVVVVATTVVAARIWAPALQVRPISWDAIFTTFYGLNYRLAVEGTQYLHQNDSVSPLQHFWSLAVEEQFYIVWPIVIVAVAAVGRRFRRPLLGLVLVAAGIVSFWYCVTTTEHLASWAYFSLHTRAWELGLGGLVALGATQLARLPRAVAELGAALGLVALVISAFVYSDSTLYPGAYAALPVAGAALVIACGCGPRCRVERLLAEPMLQCIGRVSYGWYLWHWPMLIMAPMIVGHALPWTGRLIVVWLSLAVAVVSYFAIEDPGRRLGRRTWQGFVLGAAMSGAVLAACAVVLSHLPLLVGSGAATNVVQADTASPAVDRTLRAAVSAGVEIQDAPRNLTPAPDAAAKDLPAADGTSCHASFTTIAQGPCVYGDPKGTHTAVIFGDSHADMWLGAFDRAGKANGWKIVDWTKSACPAPRITVRNSTLNRTYTECDTWREQVVRRIGALRPDLVFMSTSENLADASVTPATWSAATIATMTAVRSASGARVELLQDVPVPTFDLPSCVSEHLSSIRDCTFPTSKGHSFPQRHRDLATAVTRAGYLVVEPQPWICTEDTCPAIVGNMLVYRDDTHLTDTFSAWLAPRVAALLVAPR
jgi:peptidoglycan/LPS O-acetylase OafA/YrhL